MKEGRVSYITGQNIYVKFETTEGIENGDTLFMQNAEGLIPSLFVQQKSSISCLCNLISDIEIKVSDPVFARLKQTQPGTRVPVAELAGVV